MEKEIGLRPKFFGLAAALACLLFLCGCAVQKYSEIQTLEIRPHRTLKLLFETPATPSNTILVLFFGANGRKTVPNILSRTAPIFVGKGLPIVIVDERLYFHSSRATPEHLEDIQKVVEVVAARGFQSIYLVGTSNGTISVAHAGSHLRDERIKGLVLSGTQSYYITKHVPIEQTPYPVLFIHHKYDDCPFNSHEEALQMSKKYVNSTRVDFVTVNGGENEQPYPCFDMTYHDFWEREKEFAQAITDWVLGKAIPKEID
jgi:hypothetical protein